MDVEHDAVPGLAVREPDGHDLVPADALDAGDDEQRPLDRRERRVLDGGEHAHSRAPQCGRDAAEDVLDGRHGVGRRHVAGARHRREVDLLDRRRSDAAAERLAAAPVDVERQRKERRLLRRLAVGVVVAQRALLEHRLPHQPPGEQDDPLPVGKGSGADELRDRLEPVRLGEQLERLLAALHPVALPVQEVPGADRLRVAGGRVAPAHRRVVARVGEVAVERPRAAGEAARVRAHRLRHVAAGRRDRAEDRHRGVVAVQRAHVPRPLVEGGQLGREPGRIALFRGELVGARRDLAQRLRPAGGRVGDQHGVVAHVAEVLGDGDARVDARLAREHRHVGGVRDQHRALAQRPAGAWILERGELLEHVGHLVAALAAADVDDHVGVAPLRDLLEQHGLAGAEAAGDGRGAAPRDREEDVEHALAGDERHGGGQARRDGARAADRPEVGEAQLVAPDDRDRLVHGVGPRGGEALQRAGHAGRHQDPVLDRGRLGDGAEQRAGLELRSRLLRRGRELPVALA